VCASGLTAVSGGAQVAAPNCKLHCSALRDRVSWKQVATRRQKLSERKQSGFNTIAPLPSPFRLSFRASTDSARSTRLPLLLFFFLFLLVQLQLQLQFQFLFQFRFRFRFLFLFGPSFSSLLAAQLCWGSLLCNGQHLIRIWPLEGRLSARLRPKQTGAQISQPSESVCGFAACLSPRWPLVRRQVAPRQQLTLSLGQTLNWHSQRKCQFNFNQTGRPLSLAPRSSLKIQFAPPFLLLLPGWPAARLLAVLRVAGPAGGQSPVHFRSDWPRRACRAIVSLVCRHKWAQDARTSGVIFHPKPSGRALALYICALDYIALHCINALHHCTAALNCAALHCTAPAHCSRAAHKQQSSAAEQPPRSVRSARVAHYKTKAAAREPHACLNIDTLRPRPERDSWHAARSHSRRPAKTACCCPISVHGAPYWASWASGRGQTKGQRASGNLRPSVCWPPVWRVFPAGEQRVAAARLAAARGELAESKRLCSAELRSPKLGSQRTSLLQAEL